MMMITLFENAINKLTFWTVVGAYTPFDFSSKSFPLASFSASISNWLNNVIFADILQIRYTQNWITEFPIYCIRDNKWKPDDFTQYIQGYSEYISANDLWRLTTITECVCSSFGGSTLIYIWLYQFNSVVCIDTIESVCYRSNLNRSKNELYYLPDWLNREMSIVIETIPINSSLRRMNLTETRFYRKNQSISVSLVLCRCPPLYEQYQCENEPRYVLWQTLCGVILKFYTCNSDWAKNICDKLLSFFFNSAYQL